MGTKIGAEVMTTAGRGTVVNGKKYGKPPARGGKWVFLHNRVDNRVILFHASEVKPLEVWER